MTYFEECIERQIALCRARAVAHGWQFEERGITDHTLGDFIRAVLAVDTPEHAKAFYAGCVAFIQDEINAGTWRSRHSAEDAARANIGWCFGEGMAPEKIAMWTATCQAAHPIFGGAVPTSAEAMATAVDCPMVL